MIADFENADKRHTERDQRSDRKTIRSGTEGIMEAYLNQSRGNLTIGLGGVKGGGNIFFVDTRIPG